MNNVTIKGKSKQPSIVEWFLIVLTILFLFFMLILVPSSKPLAPEEAKIEQEKQAAEQAKKKQEQEQEKAKEPISILSFTGNQAVKSKEFTVASKEIKFVYSCDEGPVVCVAWLYQIGGAKQQLFRGRGGKGDLSEQQTLSIGPGTFYIEMDTRDREYKIDVFQSSAPVSIEETNSTQMKVDNGKKYRSVNGFKLTNEDMLVGDILYYNYETNDGIYSIALSVYPNNTNSKIDDEFTLAKGSLKINNTIIQYAFDEGFVLNGVQTIKPYESAEFIFIANDKTHVGFVQKINDESDRVGIEVALKAFVNALVPNILGDK